MRDFWAIGVGGFLGAVARYYVGLAVVRRWSAPLPIGTLAVNLVGCAVIGALLAVASEARLSDTARSFLVVGLLGSFTTFSTFGAETANLLRVGEVRLALGYVALSVLLGLGAVELGRAAARAWLGGGA